MKNAMNHRIDRSTLFKIWLTTHKIINMNLYKLINLLTEQRNSYSYSKHIFRTSTCYRPIVYWNRQLHTFRRFWEKFCFEFYFIFFSFLLLFFSLNFQVYVCPSLANLYESVNKNEWRLKYTGVPVLLHDKGSARSRCVPRVTFILAERGSSFALWQDTIDNLSAYRVAGPAFHTMCLSSGK